MARQMIRSLAIAAVLAAALVPTAAAAGHRLAGAPVPAGFVGVNLDGPPLAPLDKLSLSGQFNLMKQNDVESVRTTFNWVDEQPYGSWSDVPAAQQGQFENGAGGVPTDFAETDQIVAGAAQHRLTVLPIVMYAPSWEAAHHSGNAINAPKSTGPYANYLTTLIHRYGPRGSFWSQHPDIPKRPIRMWEIWNEPWIYYYWPNKPAVRTYEALLAAAHAAIKRADPGAKVVLAGIPNTSWETFITVRGDSKNFDVVDVHPYTKYPAGDIQILSLVRHAMDQVGDRGKPIIAGELGWDSSLHQTKNVFDWDTTNSGQAAAIRAVVPLLAANRVKLGLMSFYWYTWMGDQYHGGSPWGFSGLVGYNGNGWFAKPALVAFHQQAAAIEH